MSLTRAIPRLDQITAHQMLLTHLDETRVEHNGIRLLNCGEGERPYFLFGDGGEAWYVFRDNGEVITLSE